VNSEFASTADGYLAQVRTAVDGLSISEPVMLQLEADIVESLVEDRGIAPESSREDDMAVNAYN
jgi:hypothetical protein